MTNAPEGRTYFDYTWELKTRIMYPRFPQDYVQLETLQVVPNGKWVMERPLCGWSWTVGAKHDELESIKLTDKYGRESTLSVCDDPFGYIIADEEDVDRTVYPRAIKSSGRKQLVCARQIHKGELGQSVPIPRVDYVRQPFEPHQKLGMKSRERRRGQRGWVELSDLDMGASMLFRRLDWIELVLGYWQFSGHLSWQNYRRVGVLVDTIRGSAEDIKLGNASVVSMTPEQFRAEAEEDSDELWVRRGFAYTILRLLALGVRPEIFDTV